MDNKFQVLLIGNYKPDQQVSMQRFTEVLQEDLESRGIFCERWDPPAVFLRSGLFSSKWWGYVDKYLIGIPLLLGFIWGRRLKFWHQKKKGVVHVTDHSNAIYLLLPMPFPTLVTCHDMGAVRGALGDLNECRASRWGKVLQYLIVKGLKRANQIASVSSFTQSDLLRVLGGDLKSRCTVVHNGLNQDFTFGVSSQPSLLVSGEPYLLHVGSNLVRKNRELIVRLLSLVQSTMGMRLVLAGEGMSPELEAKAISLGIVNRIVEVKSPSTAVLEALYRGAWALIFPSTFEGFGWPVIEAQVCECPVIASRSSSLPEVCGEGALLLDPSDEKGFLDAILQLRDSEARKRLIQAGSRNAASYSKAAMICGYLNCYRELAR